MLDIEIYETEDGRRPYEKWFASVQSKRAQGRILKALNKLEYGMIGNVKTVDGPIREYKVNIDKGYRIFFAYYEQTLIVLLGGCSKDNKKEQRKAIQAAKECWEDYQYQQERKPDHEKSE